MELNSAVKLQSMFSFSNAIWILPYYGYLDQWKRLMVSISISSKKCWKEHEDAFIYHGGKFNRDFYINWKAAVHIQSLISDKQLVKQILIK